jgi:hypothetical protein
VKEILEYVRRLQETTGTILTLIGSKHTAGATHRLTRSQKAAPLATPRATRRAASRRRVDRS